MADFEYLYEDITRDVDCELEVEGELPSGLHGTFYSIGGTGSKVGSRHLHFFDAHGRVTSVHIENGKARLRARMVETPVWEQEKAKEQVVKRRLFTNLDARWSNLFNIDLGNNAWHNVVPWGKDLVATNDPGFFSLDPQSLKTRGPAPIRPAKGASFTPMVRRDPATGRHVLYETRPGMKDTLIVREVDDDFETKVEYTWKLPRGASFFHDIGFTKSYYLVVQWGSLSIPTALWGGRPIIDAVRFDPNDTPLLYLLPKDGGELIAVPLPGGRLHFHFWNAFEAEGRVVLDAIGYDGRVDFSSGYPPRTREAAGVPLTPTPKSASWRYRYDLASGKLESEKLTDLLAESPEIRPDRRGRSYRYGWAPAPGEAGDEPDRGAYGWFHALARHDFEDGTAQVWDAGPRAYVSPVAFVGDPEADADDEAAGWAVGWIQDAEKNRASLAIYDGRDITGGPIARLHADHLLGAISHVSFAAG